jgi:hypothetical protein
MSKIPFHYIISEKVMSLLEQGTHRNTTVDRLESGNIVQSEIDMKSFQLSGEIFIASADVYEGLTLSAVKLLIRIQKELKMNNPLWHCADKELSQVRLALAQLKRKEIIESIEDTEMYIVNPTKIRKGRPLSVYGALYTYAKRMYLKDKKWKPTTEDIIRLSSPKELSVGEITVNADRQLD